MQQIRFTRPNKLQTFPILLSRLIYLAAQAAFTAFPPLVAIDRGGHHPKIVGSY